MMRSNLEPTDNCGATRLIMALVIAAAVYWLATRTIAVAEQPAPPLVRLTSDGHFKQRPAWSPDGKQLVFARHADDKIWLYLLDISTGEEHRVTDRDPPEYDAVWSPDGKRLAFGHVKQTPGQGDVDVHTINPDGSDDQLVAGNLPGLSHQEWPSWSPDGARIAFTSTSPGNQEIMIAKADGSELTRLTNILGTDAHPAWSPDGKRIAFATDRWGGLEIATMNVDGSDVQRLTESRGLDDYPAWSPDGLRIAFVSNRDGNYEVYRMNADGGAPVNLTRAPGMDTFPAWTVDGSGVTFVSNRERRFEIYTLEVEVEGVTR